MVSSVVVERVNLGLSPMKETEKAAVHILFKMDYQSAMVFSSSQGRQDVKEPAVSSIFVHILLTMAFALGFWAETIADFL